jgi:predicted pyridoxine 5'-phosphate oxidase superfamily flavin-nucleotide-binding protein
MIINSKLRIALTVAVTAGLLAVAASSGRAEISKRDAQALSKADLIYIATVRKDGNQSKAAPVWFTTSADNNAILIQTGPKRGRPSASDAGVRLSCGLGQRMARPLLARLKLPTTPRW